MKKQFIFLISALSIFTLIGCNKNNEEYQLITNNSIKYLAYNGEEKVAMVVGYDENLQNEVSIPSSVNGYKVNAIRHESFVGANITKITIPESVAYIGYRTFAECFYLKEVSLPNSISTIYYNTFAECNSLETINIPSSVEEIETGAFLGCDSLKSITLSNNLTSLGSFVFYNCPILNNIDLSNTKISIINECCFASCSGLNSIKFNNISEISTGAFLECKSLSSVALPDTLLSIGNYAFSACTNLNEIFIPKSVAYIGENVFVKNKDDFKILLEANEIPALFTSNFNCYYPYVLGTNRETKIKDVFVSKDNISYAINNYQSTSSSPSATLVYPNEEFTGGELKIPGTVTYQESKSANVTDIADHAFIYNDTTTSLDLSGATKFESIGKYAFADSSINSVIFNTEIQNIDTYSFANCYNLKNIDLEKTKIANIGSAAFYYDYNLESVKLPSTVQDINLGIGAFYKCRQLNSIENLSLINEIKLNGYTFAECYNLGKDSSKPFEFSSNINSITTTDFLDWGTTQPQYIEIASDAYTKIGDEIYLNANEETIQLEKIGQDTYKNNLYFANATITLEAQE